MPVSRPFSESSLNAETPRNNSELETVPSRKLAGTGAIVAAFAIALVILSAGITAPFEKDQEPQSAQWVVDIVHKGRWLLPHDYYDFVERKPPLFYWIDAVVVELTGGRVDEARARSASLLGGAALAAVVMAWSASQLGDVTGLLAFLFIIGTYGYASRATTALTDMLMTFLMMSTYLLIYPLVEGEKRPGRMIFAGFVLALAILTKGPVALVLVGLGVFIYVLMLKANPFRLAAKKWPWVVAGMGCGIAALWYIPAFIVGRKSDLTGVFFEENFGHFFPASMGGTGEAARPVYYIVLRMLGGSLPLAFLIPALVLAFARPGFARRFRKPLLYQLAMLLAVILLFSAASAKRDDYILPGLPPLAVLFASLFGCIEPRQPADGRDYAALVRDITAGAIAAVMMAGTLGALFFFTAGGRFRPHLQSSDASYFAIFARGMMSMAPGFLAFVAAIVAGALTTFTGLWRRSTIVSGLGVAVLCLAGTLLWTGVMRPAEARTRTFKEFAAEVRNHIGDAPVYSAYDEPALSFYYGKAVRALPRSLARNGPAPGQKIYLISRLPELRRLTPQVRKDLVVVLHSHMLGGGGPPTLYLMRPVDTDSNAHSAGLINQ